MELASACDSGDSLISALAGFFQFLGDPIGTIVSMIAKVVLAAAMAVFGDLVTSVPTYDKDTAQGVSGQTQWIVVYLAIGSLIFAAIRMALDRRGEAGQVALKGLIRVIVVAGAATAIADPLARVTDRYSSYLFQGAVEQQLESVGCGDMSGVESFLMLVLAFLLLIAAIIQVILMYVRLGVVTLMLGTLPLAATASMTNWGGTWWRKHIGWLIAWLLYKPAAALVMYAGAKMLNSGGDDVQQHIAAIGLLILSSLALPALLKLIVPATAALGGGGSLSGSGLGGAVASGARVLGGSGGGDSESGGGGGASGAPGPRGASGANGSSAGQEPARSGGSGGDSGSSGSAGGRGSGGGSGGIGSGIGGGGIGGGGSGGRAAPGGGGAAAAGPAAAGAAAEAVHQVARTAGRMVTGAVQGAGEEPDH
ncbi:hypothetical protein [Phaeacidiphilus oryzae]|uniref:hypothetical protein n=1 Tax=Phaeacidiphilus oryzae TaxID=348818 RepID=UPI000560C85C|nr:hypothetical protein [Phaeacidiphilus oryzae]